MFRILSFLPFLFFAHLQADTNWGQKQDLNKHFSKDSSWVVLGFVSDTETNPMIETRGHELRKSLEMHIQSLNANVLTMSSSERLKWEKMWSLPYKGRYSKDLISQLAKAEKVNIISGSFAPHAPSELTILIYHVDKDKSQVLYTQQTVKTARLPEPISRPDFISQEKEPVKTKEPRRRILDKVETNHKVTAERQRPFSNTLRRKRMPRSLPGKMEAIKKHLNSSEVMKDFIKPFKGKSEDIIEHEVAGYIQKANKTYFSNSKMENLCRAYCLSTLLESKKGKELEEQLLEQIAEHHSFSISVK